MSAGEVSPSAGLSFGVSSSGAAPSFLFGSKPPASAGTDGVSQPAGTSAPPISSNFQTSQVCAPCLLLVMLNAGISFGCCRPEASPGIQTGSMHSTGEHRTIQLRIDASATRKRRARSRGGAWRGRLEPQHLGRQRVAGVAFILRQPAHESCRAQPASFWLWRTRGVHSSGHCAEP